MFEGIASRICDSSFGEAIPVISKNRGMSELMALVVESHHWNPKTHHSDQKDEKAFYLIVFKIIQIERCLGSLPFFASLTGPYLPTVILASLSTIYTHSQVKNPTNATMHNMISMVALSFNVLAKVVNSFAIGKMAHRAFYNDQKPGALLLTATFIALGFSSSNVTSEWMRLSDQRGNQE